jgi:DNA-binding transcriptional MerR regulator
MYGIGEVAAMTGIASHRIKYLLQKGVIPEPARVAGRRCFMPADIEAVRRHFTRRGNR